MSPEMLASIKELITVIGFPIVCVIFMWRKITDSYEKHEEAPKPDPKEVIVTGGSVNVRTAPNKETGKIMGVVHRGDILPYQGVTSSGGWYLVIYENQNGWISGKYSTLVNEECESCTI